MVKVVLFDVGGVIINFTESAIGKTLKDLGLTGAQIDWVWDELIDPKFGTGKISEDRFWETLRERFNIRAVWANNDLLATSFREVVRVNEEVISIAKNLKTNEELRIGILSDTIEPHARVLRGMGVYDPFDPVFLSHEIGRRKADPEAFCHAVQQLKVLPGEIIFVDDLPENIAQAQRLGMETVLFQSSTQLENEIYATLK